MLLPVPLGPIAAALVSAFAAFLPRVLVGLVLVFGGIIAGQMAFGAVQRASLAAGLPQAALLARSVQVLVPGHRFSDEMSTLVAGGQS